MIVTVRARIAEKFDKELEALNVEVGKAQYGHKLANDTMIDLTKMTRQEVEHIQQLFASSQIKGTGILATEIARYMRAADGTLDDMQAHSVRQAAWIVEHFIGSLPHHYLFKPDAYGTESYMGYYVNDVRFVPEQRQHDQFVPASVQVDIVHVMLDKRDDDTITMWPDEVMYKTAEQMLRDAGYVPENTVLVDKLAAETVRYYEVRNQVGVKYAARGVGYANLNNEAKSAWQRSSVRLDQFNVPTQVVVDVLHEGDSVSTSGRRSNSDARVNLFRWHEWNSRFFSPGEEDIDRDLAADEETVEAPDVQVPVHPLVPCFDLKRHLRLSVHVNNLVMYEYNRGVAAGLILPERDWALINMLVDQSTNTFRDVVAGKGSSMNVIAGGPPGTGKTLTAEVVAEFKQRPLYSVQCSQLGLNPEEVERNLGIVLTRANRWNAVLLLDEADVYIRRRGTNLTHNAIVGVFLRMLEYAECILWMTTNLAEDIDDAIASRCIVAVHYDLPTKDAQAAIWRSLADLNELDLSDGAITEFVALHPRVSGRDVKNLLKLASFMAPNRAITREDLEFALAYKPTADTDSYEAGGWGRGFALPNAHNEEND